jgi:hypothetical protein
VAKAPSSTIRVEGTVTAGLTIPIASASVCVPDHPEIACVTTAADGTFNLTLPVNQELALTLRASGMASAVVGIRSGLRESRKLVFSLDKIESTKARYEAIGAKYPDEGTGFIVARTEVQNDSDLGVDGAVLSIQPKSGTGPLYFDANSNPSPMRTSTSTWSVAAFANVTPGTVELALEPSNVTCVPSASGWAAQVTNRVRVPVLAGYETHVRLHCHK